MSGTVASVDSSSSPSPAHAEGSQEHEVVRIVTAAKREAEEARISRYLQNDLNYLFYHGKQDMSHKKAGQSQEFLPSQMMAVEQIAAMLKQGLIDFGDWFSIEPAAGVRDPLFTIDESRKLMQKWLKDCDFGIFLEDSLKSALLGSLMVSKVGVKNVPNPKFVVKRKKAPVGYTETLERKDEKRMVPALGLVRPRDWFPDPTGDVLYRVERVELDYHKLVQIAEANPDEYDVKLIKEIGVALSSPQDMTALQKSRETGQAVPASTARLRCRLLEFWGTLVNQRGEVIAENCVTTIANETWVIRRPGPNPYWHKMLPYVVAPLIRVPWSEWHKSLMDAPTMLNRAKNELFNLILDSGLASVFGVRQVRPHWILNPERLSNGLAPNDVISVGPQCPPGMKAIETVSTGAMSQEALQALNVVSSEFNSASLTNDLRMGVLPSRSVKATEVVEASQSISGTLGNVAHTIEDSYVVKVLELIWLTMLQHVDDFEAEEYVAILGPERAAEINKFSKMKRFAKCVSGHQFKVFGLTQTLNKIKDFRKLTTLLQTLSQSPTLMDEFMKRYDLVKFLTQIMKALDVDVDQIKLDGAEALMAQMGGGQGAPQGAPDMMSQTPQMSAAPPEGALQPGVPRGMTQAGG